MSKKEAATTNDKNALQEVLTWKQKTLAFLKELGIVFGLFLLINNFVVASFLVPTGSMENEVLTGELLFVNKFIYGGTSPRNLQQLDLLQIFTLGKFRMPYAPFPWFRLPAIRDVHRGDVIVFVFPGSRDAVEEQEFVFYLKRCIGTPGDTVEVRDRVVYVNNQILPIPRNIRFDRGWAYPKDVSGESMFPKGTSWNEDHYGPIVIPKQGMKIALNPANLDQWDTFIKREGHSVGVAGDMVVVDGRPTQEYTVQRDYYFGMGDHRDNSLDSRYWGFIPKDNIVGTPMIVYFSWNSDAPLFDLFGRIRWGRIGSLIK